ncbi:MAG: SRPBCC family protein [Candidatus Sumerlaeia bacterium]|nr:SRPBCC family protein [Candidatus Sumerlaeia bacterium]
MIYELTDSFVVPASPEATWEFFGKAENLPRITPPSLGFRIHTPTPIAIAEDTRIDYTVRWMGLPIPWRSRIVDWTPPTRFIDLQVRGPYAFWHHEHSFHPHPRGTECRDRVLYGLPGGMLAAPVHALVVRRQLLGIFRYRRQAIGTILGPIEPLQPDVSIRRAG